MRNIGQIIDRLPADRRAKVKARSQELIGQEAALQHLRKARQLTQAQMARTLHIGQDSVSRLESRSDLLISTLQSYVEAMGGSLMIQAKFKEGTVTLTGLGISEEKPQTVKRKPRQLAAARAQAKRK